MTREEAIYRLKNMAWLYGSAEREQNIEAIDMAIEALQREEAEAKGYCHRIKPKEYLSADAVPTVIRAKTFMRKEDFDKWADDIKKQNKNIVCIPCDAEVVSADAEQGVWEHIESKWADNIFKCSKCGNPLIIPTVDGEPIYNYCVHCGAKMGNAWGERND